ncbi:MAG TPA: Rieske 2Fe-2S domain-containing protein [Terriglobales bacterium]|nr:Rieske 2Fe-2S domain-containing protein [Terriglobales bacterium]
MSLIGEAKQWIAIARAGDLPLREGRVVVLGSREIAVFNLGDRVLAVANHCPHKNGPLADGILSGGTIVCPLHARKFDLETGEGANALSAEHCLETFPMLIKNGIVFIALPLQFEKRNQIPATCLDHAEGDICNPSSANAQ